MMASVEGTQVGYDFGTVYNASGMKNVSVVAIPRQGSDAITKSAHVTIYTPFPRVHLVKKAYELNVQSILQLNQLIGKPHPIDITP